MSEQATVQGGAQSGEGEAVVVCRGLTKTYRVGFWLSRKVEALRGLDLEVKKGEVFGFLGPNGAGKSTTLKILTRLIRPTSGSAAVFGRPPGDAGASARVGFLPENPVFYDHLTGRELLAYYAALVRVPRARRAERVKELLDLVGLTRAADYQVRRYSKGMVERLGIAQSLLQDPELVILDEPTSGLDPLGRREVRELIMNLRSRGKTVFFSTHIIPDVEMVCDRVGMLIGGRLSALGTVKELMHRELASVEVVLEGAPDEALRPHLGEAASIHRVASQAVVTVPSMDAVEPLLRSVFAAGGKVVRVAPSRYSLEELFLKEAHAGPDHRAPER